MYGRIKRLLALLMALSILVSLCGMTVSATQETVGELAVGQTVQVTTGADAVYLRFVPQETGAYDLFSEANTDTVGMLYDADMGLLREDDDSGEGNNFSITCILEAGRTYYVGVRCYDNAVGVVIPVRAERSAVERVEYEPLQIIENANGDMQDVGDGRFWYYYWNWTLQYTVYFTDGTSQQVIGNSFEYDGRYYNLRYTDSQYQQPWTVGNTYYPTVELCGITSTVSVEVIESPVASVTCQPVTIMEGTRCYTTYGDDGNGNWVPYTEYHWYTEVEADITLKTGEVIHVSGNDFAYNGIDYGLDYEIGQSAAAPWQKDNTYTVSFNLLGYPCQTTVTIEGSPVARIEADPITLTENMNGYWTTGYSDQAGGEVEYYSYNWSNQLNLRVYFKDGTVQEVSGGGFYYQGLWISTSYDIVQTANDPWLVGNTYEVTIRVMEAETVVPITIEPSPIASVTVEPIVLAENKNGYFNSDWNGTEYVEYYHYWWSEQMNGTVTFRDGSTQKFSNYGFYYMDDYYSVSYTDHQSETPYLVGNTYTETVTVGGQTAQVEITVAQSALTGDYGYVVLDGNAILTEYIGEDTKVTIPSTLDGRTVTGIMSLDEGLEDVEELVIPDTVTMLSNSAFDYAHSLKKLHLGAGIANYNDSHTWAAVELEGFTVSADNPNYTAVDGVVYNKQVTAMVAFPQNKQNTHKIPDSVTDISVAFTEWGSVVGANVETGAGTPQYVTVDGVVYNREMTKIYSCALEKTGTYTMPESVTEIASLALAKTNLDTVRISPNVTTLTYGTFLGSKVKTVAIPAAVREIGPLAFDGCTQLETLDVDSVELWCQTSIGDIPDTLWNLTVRGTKVEDLVIPDVVTVVYGCTFENAKLRSVTFPSSVKSIEYSAFAGSTVETVRFSEGLEYLGDCAFEESGVKAVHLPDTLEFMEGGYQFAGCTQLTELTLGAGIDYIGYCAFMNTAITEVVIPEKVTYIDEEAFQNCSKLRSVDFKNPEIYIGYRAFFGCPIETLDLSNGVEYIGERAFSGNQAISLVIPETVTEITYRCFENSTNLVGVVIPESVTYINTLAFYGSTNISHVYYGGTQTQWETLAQGCHELNNGNLHTESDADDFIVNYTCTRMEHYCRICGTWDYVEYDEPRHNMVNGVCTVCGEGDSQKEGWIKENGRWTYYRRGEKLKDAWVNDNGWYYLDASGYMAVNRWVEDSNGWCYLGSNGKMVYNQWIRDSQGWCYVDKTGYMVYNQWVKDSKGWCYVGKNGYMVYNQWVKDSVGWCYVDKSGYMVYNQWVKDSKGWCYVDKSGYMVYNQWVKDSVGWCYVDKSGYMVYNQWVKDSVGWCYVDKSGYMVYNQWIKDSKGWCYVDKSGYMACNQWVKTGSYWYYVDGNGYMLANTSRWIGGKNYRFNASGACTNP